jgi:hypothetical protein
MRVRVQGGLRPAGCFGESGFDARASAGRSGAAADFRDRFTHRAPCGRQVEREGERRSAGAGVAMHIAPEPGYPKSQSSQNGVRNLLRRQPVRRSDEARISFARKLADHKIESAFAE